MVAGGELREPPLGAGRELAPQRRNRVAVRVMGGVAEPRGDAGFEPLGQRVLERLGLVVHLVERHAQRPVEKQFEQAVVPQHLQRHPLALGGQPGALVRRVRHQPLLGQLTQHTGHAGGRHPERGGERLGAHLTRLPQPVKVLEVILGGRREGAGHTESVPGEGERAPDGGLVRALPSAFFPLCSGTAHPSSQSSVTHSSCGPRRTKLAL